MTVAPSAALISATINPVAGNALLALPAAKYFVKYVGKEEGF